VEISEMSSGPAWVPSACTLPTAQQPLRVADFDALLADAVQRIEHPQPTRLHLDLEPSPQTAGRAAELAMAETACCSFFTFTLTASEGGLALDITVPERHAAVLQALADRAVAAVGPGE
jgi:hypothetical protein